MTFFIRACPPTKAIGWKPATTVTASDRRYRGIGGLTGTVTGFGPIRAGTGTPTSVLGGQPTTTAGGSISVGRGGAGSPEANGRPRGSPGGRATNTLAGPLFRRKQITLRVNRYRPGPTHIMTSDRLRTLLSTILIGANLATHGLLSDPNETFRSSGRLGMSRTSSPITT